jgi:ATP-dependent DNA helicase PIF1
MNHSTPQLDKALHELRSGTSHLFITGRAGTGKSTLLEKFREEADRPVVVLAPTGVAALNVHGQTIHSFFKLFPNASLDDAKSSARRDKRKELFASLTELVIDEISMVRSDLLDCMNVFLQQIRGDRRPFGGVRMVLFGDLYQLPPVVSSREREEFYQLYESPYFFGSQVFASLLEGDVGALKMIELEHIFRQSDAAFIEVLNNVRTKTVTEAHLKLLNSRVGAPIAAKTIVLTGRRDTAQQLNDTHIAGVSGEAVEYQGRVEGKFPEGSLPTQMVLGLKAGARVMMVANDSKKRWVNGTLGTIIMLGKESVVVQTDEGDEYVVEPFRWELSQVKYDVLTRKLEREIVGSFSQLPLMVAHAVTIHKAQGKTFDRVCIDLQHGSFAHGQTYVALSRCRTLEGMSLTQAVTRSHIMMDSNVSKFLAQLQLSQGAAELPF